jgi:cytochrome c553
MKANSVALNYKAAGAIVVICILWCALAVAQADDHQPDIARGAAIAAQGVPPGAPACAQCHAYNGASDGSGAFPRIAAQSAYYLAKQLRDYASGVRTNAVMTPIAKALSSADTTDVAAYYASVSAPFLPLKNAQPMLVKRGEQLANIGDAAKDLQSCNSCHGPGGAGEPPAIPYLGGQYARYIAFQLTMWKRGFRKNSPDAMAGVAKRLDDQEIAAVAAYFQKVDASALAATQPTE